MAGRWRAPYFLDMTVIAEAVKSSKLGSQEIGNSSLGIVLEEMTSIADLVLNKFKRWIPEFFEDSQHTFDTGSFFMRDEEGGIRPHSESLQTVVTKFYLPGILALRAHGTAFLKPKKGDKKSSILTIHSILMRISNVN